MPRPQHYLLLVLFLFLCTIPSPAQTNSRWYQVSKIVDGDTFWIINAKGQEEKIRLIGVDAPESRKTGKKEIGYYGKESKAYVTQLLTGRKVRLEYDVSKYDRYKRTLAYVYLENGTFLNAFLIKNGYASVMTVPPNVRHADLFVQLQREARENKRGLWK
ncbi:thermonuclease family protein [Aquiflexum sp. LQ15W]|uniref:thermonuclease family protein n=1 Tax=Cognataquiflexum nitidum TaxID=2922272 RepID=UPI001F143305|nr:thermonuclease family protein [Cognataquiflexum nitidum]MCH6200722.1 thermonuclease family protein [Cognataquiflexum nitidum]